MPSFRTLLRLPSILSRTGLGRSTLYRRIDSGLFPRPIRIGPRTVAWPETEIDAINAARAACKSDPEIRELVDSLHQRRQAPALDSDEQPPEQNPNGGAP